MYKPTMLSILLSLCVVSTIIADTITIINKTPIDLFGALYFVSGTAERVAEPIALLAGKSVKMKRPDRRSGYDRALYVSPDVEFLTQTLSSGQSQFIVHATVGNTKGATFYILFDQHAVHIYGALEKKAAPLLKSLRDTQQKLTDAMFGYFQKSYAPKKSTHTSATVRTTATVGQQEQKFLQKRKEITKKAIESIVGHSLTDAQTPTIALCASGGGYRAMISFLGSLQGFKQSGLADSVTYMAGLSGGAWAVTVATMVDDPIAALASRLDKSLTADVDPEDFLSQLWKKFIFKQSLSMIDVYGLLLANRLLGGQYKAPLLLTLSQQQKRIANAERPFPLYAGIVTKKPYEWIECNPYEVSSRYLRGAVPTWAFGSSFANGKSKSIDPEQSLGFFMGLWGSAMSANMQEIYAVARPTIDSSLLLSVLDKGTDEQVFGRYRIWPAKVHNFTFGLTSSPRWQQDVLTLIDAGIDFNVPVPLLLGRADIIIIFDNSLDVLTSNGNELKRAAQYAKERNIPFVTIDDTDSVKKQCSVFFDRTNAKAPLIIYFPLINNPRYAAHFDVQKCMEMSYCGTQNFSYTEPQMKELAGLTAFTATEYTDTIRQAIKEWVQMRQALKETR